MEEASPQQRELEVKIAYLEENATELNRVVFQQQQKLDRLSQALRQLSERVEELEEPQDEDGTIEPPPPHY